MLTRSCVGENFLPPDFNLPFVNLSLRLPLKQKQGIGIIFIADYFATCFARRVGPLRDCDHFDLKK